MDYIVLSIPIFFILIGVELLVARLRHTKLYRFNDALTNISCGITQQVIGVLSKTVLIMGYIYIHEHWRLLDIEENVWTLVSLFIGIDFFYYWFHRYAHEVSLFWGTHIVHHQSEEYNLSVALRQSSLQGFVSVAFYFPLAWIGFNPISFVAISAFQTLYQFWIHTKVIDKLPSWFEYVFNTPSHHRVHHGRNPKYIDKNHGGTLIIWDRLFGTFQPEEEEVIYGVTKPLSSWNPIWANLDWYVDLWSDLKQPMHWRDRIRLLFSKPGWLPAYLAASRQVSMVDAQSVPKYDTEIPLGLNHYILSQYIFILAGTSAFLFNIELFSVLERWIASSLVVISVMVIGGFFELRRWAFYLEWMRWSLLLMSLYYFVRKGLIMDSLLFVTTAIGALSLVWFTNYASNFSKKMIR